MADTRAFIERARARRQAPAGLDSELLAALLTWMNENVLYLAFTGAAPEFADDERLARTQSEIWIRAIFGGDPALGD